MTSDQPSVPVSTSIEPALQKEQRQLYSDVLSVLSACEVPHAVSGAFALQKHTGIWRMTKDLDIFLTSETLSSALRLLGQRGFCYEICDPVWLAKVHRGDFFVDFITGMSNATITVTDLWIARAKAAVLMDVNTRILAAEELLASKLFVARRERFDGADIAHIIYGTRGKIDWERVLEVTGVHWEMLLWALVLYRYVYPAYSHYVPMAVWTSLINRLTSKLVNPDPTARFRGTLVDENMFAIDVDEWALDDILSEYRACRLRKILPPNASVA